MGRTLWILVTGGLLTVGGLLILAVALAVTLVPCAVALVSFREVHVCSASLWPASWVPWVLLTGAVVLAAALPIGTLRILWRQTSNARRRSMTLLAARLEPPERVGRAAAAVGAQSVAVVGVPEFVALTQGLLRPTVVVSEGLVGQLDDDQLRAVLAHEAEHARRHDPARVAVARAAVAALWPFPIARDIARHLELAAEIAADRAAIEATSLRALAGALSAALAVPHDEVAAAAISSIGGLSERIRLLDTGSIPSLRPSTLHVITSITSAALLTGTIVTFLLALARVGAIL